MCSFSPLIIFKTKVRESTCWRIINIWSRISIEKLLAPRHFLRNPKMDLAWWSVPYAFHHVVFILQNLLLILCMPLSVLRLFISYTYFTHTENKCAVLGIFLVPVMFWRRLSWLRLILILLRTSRLLPKGFFKIHHGWFYISLNYNLQGSAICCSFWNSH